MHITTKELSYLSDSMKNEDMLTKLCMHGVVESNNQQLAGVLAQIAETRFNSFVQLQDKLQEKARMAH